MLLDIQPLSEDIMTRDNANMIAFLRWINECNTFEKSHFIDFVIEDAVLGMICRSNLSLFEEHPQVFQVSQDRVTLHPCLDNPGTRTLAVSRVSRKWHKKGGSLAVRMVPPTSGGMVPCLTFHHIAVQRGQNAPQMLGNPTDSS